MRAVLGLVALTGCFSAPPRPVASDAATTGASWLPGFSYRKPITLRRGFDEPTLQDSMVSIATDADSELAMHARQGGRDIVFTLADGTTKVPHELAAFDPATGALDAWARIPELVGGESEIFMYYGASIQLTQSPWPDVYLGVWHMTGTALGRESDSTGRVSDIVPSALIETPGIAAGVAGKARDYQLGQTPGDGDELCTQTDQLQVGTGSFTYSIWLYNRSVDGEYDTPFVHGGTDVATVGFDLELGTAPWMAAISDGEGGSGDVQGFSVGEPVMNAWLFLAIVVDREVLPGTMRIYRNGKQTPAMQIASTIGSASTTFPHQLCIGSEAYRFDGLIDEVWVRTGAWSADKILAHYTNLADRAAFHTIGTEQTPP